MQKKAVGEQCHSSMNGRHSEQLPWRDAINLISGLGGWFCGGAAVVGGFGTEAVLLSLTVV